MDKCTITPLPALTHFMPLLGVDMAPAEPPYPAQHVPRLLLVDDEPRLLASLRALLQDDGYELMTASCGREAVELLEQMPFDLALLDLRLPDLGGHQIMDIINRKKLDTTVIVLSGETGIEGAIGALKRGAYDYLRKPYSREELINTVGNALRQRRLEADNRRIAQQLDRSEKLYRYLVDSSPDIIYTLDEEGRFSFINDRVQQLLGFTRGELLGSHYSLLVHEEDLERAYYVFNERRTGERASRNVELRLKSVGGRGKGTIFDNTVMTLSFNSMGMYASREQTQGPEFFGTYGVARDITERKRAEEMISYQAYHDILTDLPNRALFKDRLGLAIAQAQRKGTELAVMFIDLDRFKLVNDTLGHICGDELLQQVATRLKAALRQGDTLARLGGDEFTLCLPELQNRHDAQVVADKALECLQKPFQLAGSDVHISASIGIAIYPHDGESIDELLCNADMAMYQVKAQGKNGYSFYEPSMLEASHQKITLEQSLRRALEQDELEMYYQPQVDARTGCIIGVEGLMRWHHPERGLLSAGSFLPFAEENGLMLPISDWMLQALCRDLAYWNTQLEQRVRLSLNISPQYLDRGDFVEKMKSALIRHRLSPSQIEVEITENVCIRNPQHAIEQLNKLGQIGVSVAIDDFGTGYSSLAYLHRFPVHTIKIDQSFIKEIQQQDGHYPVVLAIISIAQGLGLNVIAEGVETSTQMAYLQQVGCITMQGYLYHKAVSASQLLQLLRSQAPQRASA
jgi:diguanylate cyclase (GGDEF)-like protein/PAS domain S-box-containing protein